MAVREIVFFAEKLTLTTKIKEKKVGLAKTFFFQTLDFLPIPAFPHSTDLTKLLLEISFMKNLRRIKDLTGKILYCGSALPNLANAMKSFFLQEFLLRHNVFRWSV